LTERAAIRINVVNVKILSVVLSLR